MLNNQFITLNNFINRKEMPNLFFYGISGTGKTTLVIKIRDYLYKNNTDMFYMLNGSEKVNLDIFKTEMKTFCEIQTFNDLKIKKMIIIDEADSLTNDSQNYIQTLMKKYHKRVFFCIICNYKNNINDVIQSLCVPYYFKTPSFEKFKNIMLEEMEEGKIEESVIEDIYHISNKDIRKGKNIINIIKNNEINNIYKFFNYPSKNNLNTIYEILNDKNIIFYDKYLSLKRIFEENNILLKHFLKDFLLFVINEKKIYNDKYIQKIGEIEYNLSKDCNEEINFLSLISLF